MPPEASGSTSPGPSRWADFLELGEDDPRELIDGRLLEIDLPNKAHEWIVSLLVMHLMNWALPRAAGIALASGFKVRIRHDRGVMPDVQFLRRGGRPVPEHGLASGAPDLAVEVVSPTSAHWDRVVKREWYASIGTAEYWIVDPKTRTLERRLLSADRTLALVETLSGDTRFAPDSFPGLEIDLGQLWNVPEI